MSLRNIVNQMVLEEALKKAEPLAKQLGMTSIPDEMMEMICPNLNYSGQFTPELYVRYQSVKQTLKELSEQTTPKHGHIVFLTTQYGIYDEAVLLLREREIRNQNFVCCVGGKNIDDLILGDYGLDMHIGSGGPFEPVSEKQIQSLSAFDFHVTSYRFWGKSPCGNGMITVSVPMKRWHLSLSV